ncbi:hypothetical protein Dimus_011128, partial [Dionaea muscipula]
QTQKKIEKELKRKKRDDARSSKILARNSEKGLSSASDGFVPYKGKHNLLSWLIDSGIVELSEKVRYMNRK